MATIANATPQAALKVHKSTAKTLTVIIKGKDLSGDTVNIVCRPFAGGTIGFNVASATPDYSGGDSTLAFPLTTTHTNLSWSRGIFTIWSLTTNTPELAGPLFVESWGES